MNDVHDDAEIACVFCKIIVGRLPADIVYKDDWAVIVRDREPKAATHLIAITCQHVLHVNEASAVMLFGALQCVRDYAKKHLPNGYRVVINTGDDAGQTVKHLHIHILGGEKLKDF